MSLISCTILIFGERHLLTEVHNSEPYFHCQLLYLCIFEIGILTTICLTILVAIVIDVQKCKVSLGTYFHSNYNMMCVSKIYNDLIYLINI